MFQNALFCQLFEGVEGIEGIDLGQLLRGNKQRRPWIWGRFLISGRWGLTLLASLRSLRSATNQAVFAFCPAFLLPSKPSGLAFGVEAQRVASSPQRAVARSASREARPSDSGGAALPPKRDAAVSFTTQRTPHDQAQPRCSSRPQLRVALWRSAACMIWPSRAASCCLIRLLATATRCLDNDRIRRPLSAERKVCLRHSVEHSIHLTDTAPLRRTQRAPPAAYCHRPSRSAFMA